ncbi:hypothetical protein [Tropicimonas marinistellae]|uniref:hypothetical protein n=1 Tax=Tropicimonas marinistellae TaxID=1739787 RepID=UPI0008303C4C|nr:hypothetical protein [Tropicimonas marinistellae]
MALGTIADMAVWIHFMGLIPGLLYALAADATALQSLRRPLAQAEIQRLVDYHRIISIALVLLWASGLTLIWLKLGPGGGTLTPKLMVKIAVVLMLTANATAIGQIGLSTMAARREQRFGDLPARLRLGLGAIAGLSAGCWLSAFALGMVKPLASMGFADLALRLGPAFLLCLLAGLALATIAPDFARVQDDAPDDPNAVPQH